MDCSVIRDLLPLYADGNCSDETRKLVEEHIASCPECKAKIEVLKNSERAVSKEKTRHDLLRASILQAVLFFVSFAAITVGILLESRTPYGSRNGLWAFAIVIPATGFLLALANWFFIRLYKSKRAFSNVSLLATVVFTIVAFAVAWFHYGLHTVSFTRIAAAAFERYWSGLCIIVGLCILSKVLAVVYANMVGKE